MSGCDCDDCGGVKDCGCAVPQVAPAAASGCSNGACSVTSQSMGRQQFASPSSAHAQMTKRFRSSNGLRLAVNEIPAFRMGPQAQNPGANMGFAAMSGPIVPADMAIPKFDGYVMQPQVPFMYSASGQVAVPPTKAPGGSSVTYTYPGQPASPPSQPGVSEAMAGQLIASATAGVAGILALIQSVNQQASETERARFRADTERQIALLQSQGLLPRQAATDALNALQNANPPPPAFVPPPPKNWWERMPTAGKVGVVGGAAVATAAVGFGIWKLAQRGQSQSQYEPRSPNSSRRY